MIQDHFEAALRDISSDVLTVYDFVEHMPVKRRPTICEARYRLRELVRCGRLRYAGFERAGECRIRQYRRP